MEASTAVSRRQPQPPPSPTTSAPHHGCTSSGGDDGRGGVCRSVKAWGTALAPVPVPGGSGGYRKHWSVCVVVACLCLFTFVIVPGAHRSAPAFFSGMYWASTSPPPQRLSTVAELPNGVVSSPSPSPSPSTGEKLTHPALRRSITSPAPSPAPTSNSSSAAKLHKVSLSPDPSPSSGVSAHDDKLLGGLLAAGLDEGSCLSRYQSYAYRRATPHKPSPYLLQRLREYEALHRRCGPPTRPYKRSLRLLKAGGRGLAANAGCKYVVWDPENGLGNRMLSVAATFLYALLSGRVLLVGGSTDLAGLFCEAFPGSTWMLPVDFPLRNLPFNQKYSESFGNLLRARRIGTNDRGRTQPPAFVYAHLSHDYDDYDKRFYCEDDQLLLEKVTWMVLRSDQYYVPALFSNPAFERELVRMFPEKEAVFHHLGRYLFHPSNEVWGLITGYYKDHLATARERLGIQIRVFDAKLRPFELILRQVLNCTMSEKLLPMVDLRRRAASGVVSPPSKAVLVTSLHSVFYWKMKRMYAQHPAAGGEVISFHQPSHEEEQRTGRAAHDRKALAEMYLLSLVDALVTSSWSTFGYVAQGLGGTAPWVLLGPVHEWVPEPACVRDLSPEPCFHFPPDYDCKTGGHADMTTLLAYTRHCKDFDNGIKLVDRCP